MKIKIEKISIEVFFFSYKCLKIHVKAFQARQFANLERALVTLIKSLFKIYRNISTEAYLIATDVNSIGLCRKKYCRISFYFYHSWGIFYVNFQTVITKRRCLYRNFLDFHLILSLRIIL